MSENNEEKSEITNSSSTLNNEIFQNLAGNLLKNEKSLGSIMQLATNLLKNDSVLHSITERAAANQISKNPVSKEPEKQENAVPTVTQNHEHTSLDLTLELSSLSQKLDHIINDISALKIELQDLKEQNNKLFKKRKK
ncbi:regulator of replication initiation timing [Bacillus sp. SORGH_AS 510]|uniref:hypothetical protein n=1 Tax=Bacillus sp. SORGH_AS_0510 TaxID=3041771 RepID=UPI00278434B3|nr:hypothetical protein [Bacillus sp. SORGH_AS_0510]MDQ1147995.1 regulator of replication initiation timing [Bacillus sp. SORGH_AS_0510]